MEGDGSNQLYRECLRNHAASLGSYATDGCGEFTPDETMPGRLQCEACGCHRSFHRKLSAFGDGDGGRSSSNQGREHSEVVELLEYNGGEEGQHLMPLESQESERTPKKRTRTKFTAEQKDSMLEFAERLGWKIQRRDKEDEIEQFCSGIGVSRQVFKMWMHNHRKPSSSSSASTTANAASSSHAQ